MQQTAARTQTPEESSVANLSRDSRIDSQPVGVAVPREIAARDQTLPREAAAAIVPPVREMQTNSAKTPLTQAVNVVDSTEAGETLNPVRIPPQSVKMQAETTAAEFVASRGAEMPQQVSQAQPQPTVTALSAAVQGAASSTVASPVVTPSPLPTQLETMSLARGADAAEWGNGVGDRVGWMINQKQNSATIRLDPPMLGKLDVQVKIADDATTITIQTQHAQTRELIESASLRLRDFLQESGYQNVNVDVSQRQDQQQARAQSGDEDQVANAEDAAAEQESVQAQHQQNRYFSGDGIVDTFA
jgi:flagellar hook-length control protein FliK